MAAAVLHAGNITFDVKAGSSSGEDDGSRVSAACSHHFKTCCRLLELEEEALEKVLCVRTIVAPEQVGRYVKLGGGREVVGVAGA